MQQLISPAVDGALIVLLCLVMPRLAERFHHVEPGNALIMLLAYFALVAGTYLLKLSRPAPALPAASVVSPGVNVPENSTPPALPAAPADGNDWGRAETTGCVVFLALPYSFFVLVAMLMSGGYLQPDQPLFEAIAYWTQGHPGLIAAVGMGMLLFVGAFTFAIVARPVRRLDPASAAGLLTRALGLAGVNCMALMTAAWWDGYLLGADQPALEITAQIFAVVVIFVLYLVFWAPPRLVLLTHDPGRYSLLGFITASAIAAVRVVF